MEHQFSVKDMTCGHCEKVITEAVKALDRQAIVKVDLANHRVTVDSIEPRDNITAAITEEGYTPTR